MIEKIKISLPVATLDLLKKDCLDFKILKNDGKINFNAFINTLILNFYEEFSAAEENLYDSVKKTLINLPKRQADEIFPSILKIFAKRESGSEEKKKTTTFSFKPTKNSEKAVVHIENVLLSCESISSFYRRLFLAYSQKTKNEREKIIHKENYEILKKAVEKQTTVCISLTTGIVMKDVSVYGVFHSKDELFNYVLCFNKNNTTVRLATIRSVSINNKSSFIPEENIRYFEKQVSCAVQYPISNTDNQPIQVILTKKGKELFNKIYLYRPTPISINGDEYVFDCSANQLLYYFERFGENALIVSPKKLGVFMRNYYHFALKKYNTIYKSKN
ncbi:MAG: hypothetical protein IJY57_00415 [Clostridia bacterium]|nr:hypothetical protein [Clostridia bacterium]